MTKRNRNATAPAAPAAPAIPANVAAPVVTPTPAPDTAPKVIAGAVAAPSAGVITPEVQAVLDTCNRIANSYVAAEAAVEEAKAAVGRAETGQLRGLGEALIDPQTGLVIPGITSDVFKRLYASPTRMALVATGKLLPASIGPALSRIKIATIALSHGIDPEGNESLKAFSERVKALLKARGLYTPENGGGEGRAKAGKAAEAAAEAAEAAAEADGVPVKGIDAACLVLARGDLADAELFRIIASDPAVLVAVRALVGKIHKPE